MRSAFILLFIAVSWSLYPSASRAEVYRCVGTGGAITLQQVPCTATSIAGAEQGKQASKSTLENLASNKDVKTLIQRCAAVEPNSQDDAVCHAALSCIDEGRYGKGLSSCIDAKAIVKLREFQTAKADEQRHREAERTKLNRKQDELDRAKAAADGDPTGLFHAGDRLESDKLSLLIDTHFPIAKYYPDQSFRVAYRGASYLVRTRKINDTGIPAIYEILSVAKDGDAGVDAQSVATPGTPQRQRPHAVEVVDCATFRRYLEAQGYGFIERGALTSEAQRKGLCVSR